ncbi:MAG: LuxR C-terminal-related transcriptional regulator [Labedaea sp.]
MSRPRLLAALDRSPPGGSTVVCAPAGSGKTLLLADWVRRDGLDSAAWVSLDAADNDERRFWSGLLDAVAACPSVPADSVLRVLTVPRRVRDDPGFLAEALDAFAALPVPVRLILDDVHELAAPEPLHGLEQLLRHRPAGLRLVLSTRWDPPLPLARLRLTGQVDELRSEALRFRPAEAAALVEAAGVRLDAGQVTRLVARTEGWAGGLRLAAVALAAIHDPDRFVDGFVEGFGTERSVSDYLIDEVLAPLSEPERDFLRAISVCEQVSVSLAVALSGRADAGDLLAALEHRTSMLARTGRRHQTYRLRALLRSYLLADLMLRAPHQVPQLHRRAAQWLRTRSQPAGAVAHALEAGDAELVADLLRRHALDLVLAGEHEVLRRAETALNAGVSGDPWLALTGVLVHLDAGEPAAARAQLTRAERAWPAEPSGELRVLRDLVESRFAHAAGDIEKMVRTVPGAGLEYGPALSAMTLVHTGLALLASDRAAAARRPVESALALARDRGLRHLEVQCLTILSGVAASEGDLRRMAALATEADGLAAERGWGGTLVGARASLTLAEAALVNADPVTCLANLARAEQVLNTMADMVTPAMRLLVGTLRGAASFDLGERSAGLRQMRDARLADAHPQLPAYLVALALTAEHRAATLLGRGDIAKEVVRWARDRIPAAGEIQLVRAGAQLALGRHSHARNLLRPLLDGAIPPLLAWTTVEAWLLEAEIAVRCDEGMRARRGVGKALALAEQLGAPHPLVLAGSRMLPLIEEQRSRAGPRQRFAAEVLRSRAALGEHADAIALTERERTVLRLLPTVRSLEEIADDLMVSPNTVKTHMRAIYRKLGVGSRREAVTSATERGLVDVGAL